MPTASERASTEADGWHRLQRWSAAEVPALYADRPADERSVVVYYDPAPDLVRRAEDARADPVSGELNSLARLAAQLASDEANAWSTDVPDAAMRAYHLRRNLVGDRIVHWAVPWLEAVGRCYPDHRDDAHADRDWLLAVADEMRVLPSFAHGEGLTLPGEDSFGPTELREPWTAWIRSLWSGRLMLDATLRSMGLDPGDVDSTAVGDLAVLYEVSAARWTTVAAESPGSAGLWIDLARRADRTADMLIALA